MVTELAYTESQLRTSEGKNIICIDSQCGKPFGPVHALSQILICELFLMQGLTVNEFMSAREPNTSLHIENDVIQHLYGTEHLSKWRDLFVVIGVAIACRFILYFFLVAHDHLQPYFRLWQIQHENKTISSRNVVEQTRRLTKSLTPPHRSMVSSTASEEFEMRLKRSKDINELAIVPVQE